MTHQPDVRNPPMIRLLQEHRFAALAAAVLVGVGLIAVTGGLTTQSRPTHRSVYDKVQAAYFYVSYPSRQQAVATPAQMTVEVHTFLGKIEALKVPNDEISQQAALVSAAQDEIAALCQFPASRADELSSLKNLNEFCPAARPSHFPGIGPFEQLGRAQDALSGAVEALPIR